MRQLKFRYVIKDEEGNNLYITDPYDVYLTLEGELYTVDHDKLDAVLLQYTGARDNDNNEIYEGDICYFTPMLVETVPTFKGVIEWDNFRFTIRNLDYDANNFLTTPYVNLDLFCVSVKKIGNIYENPELLQVKN